jgi:hypothetical protein
MYLNASGLKMQKQASNQWGVSIHTVPPAPILSHPAI